MRFARMKHLNNLLAAGLLAASASAYAADAASTASVPVTMTVTASVADGKRMPAINRDDVMVKQGKDRLTITDWVPARGNRAGMELFVLIDDSAESRLSLHYDDLRSFLRDQPASTRIGVGYMRNGTVQIAQQLTTDHDLAAQALRMPIGSVGAYGSPYLSVVNLMKSWPVDENRRAVILLTDGIGRNGHHLGWHRGYHLDADVDTATAVAQRTGTNIYTIYTPGSVQFQRGYWTLMNGQFNMARLSENTGGASYYLGLQSPVSIRPYLEQMQTAFNHQYLLSFSAKPGKRSGLQSIQLSTEVAGVNLSAHNAVWVAGGK